MIDIMENKVLGPAIRQGMREGMHKGMHKGQVRIVAALMKDRFGPLPDWASKKLAEASERQLVTWTKRSLTAKTLDGVFRKLKSSTAS